MNVAFRDIRFECSQKCFHLLNGGHAILLLDLRWSVLFPEFLTDAEQVAERKLAVLRAGVSQGEPSEGEAGSVRQAERLPGAERKLSWHEKRVNARGGDSNSFASHSGDGLLI